jgi:hypothetical protein
VSPVMLSCAQELKRRVVANANASFDFMVVEFIGAEMPLARGKSSREDLKSLVLQKAHSLS